MRTRTVALALLSLAACGSSSDDDGFRIIDQSGGEFLWVCPPDSPQPSHPWTDWRGCEIHRIAGVSPEPRDCQDPSGLVVERAVGGFEPQPNRFFGALAVCYAEGFHGGPYSYLSGHERYLICDADDDCPQPITDGPGYACVAGFCQDVDLVGDMPSRWDMTHLCCGDLLRFGGDCPADRIAAVYEACPDENDNAECVSIPAGCPDPR